LTAKPPIPAATVILSRQTERGLEVFLLKRHRASTFMSNAYVFPGGRVDEADGSPEVAAIRELFEEAGVWLADPLPEDLDAERRRLNADETTFPEILARASATPDLTRLHWWARWVTPSAEPKRFDAQFFVAELPPGQSPSFDQKETVEELWITPAEALERQAAGTLRLPPPQLRTLIEMSRAGDLAGVIAASGVRQRSKRPMCPRISSSDAGISIVLPWDPDYVQTEGEGEPVPADDVLAGPPSRFLWNGSAWTAL
jgi:8-oxo-dGTP pyrophosphatase MutT (NUDIX family)